MTEGDRVGLVLAGGGARGAYEAGAMSVILPELERRGERPTVIVGTSVGALNAAFLAANAHLHAEHAAERLRQRWLELEPGRVMRSVLGQQTALAAARYTGEFLGLPGVHLGGLLDAEPLRHTLAEWIDWPQLHDNFRGGVIESLSVAATSAHTAHSVLFVEGLDDVDLPHSAEMDFVATDIDLDHVRASAAIPTLFPAVHIDWPASSAGWYFDGGTRLNTPLKPALDLGVDRVVIVSTHAVDPHQRANWHEHGEPPDFADGAIHLLFATLVDSLIEDVRMLGKINLLVAGSGASPASREYREYKERRGKPLYRQVPYQLVAPERRDTVGDVAAEVFGRRLSGLGGLRSPDLAFLSRLFGGVSEPHGELLSYILFDPEFAEALLELGQADARTWLQREWAHDGPWLVGPPDMLWEEP